MMNLLKIRTLSMLMLSLSLVVPVSSLAQDDPITITAPDGSFTTTLPAGWTDESPETGDYLKYTQADGTVFYLMRVEGDTEADGVDAALAVILPGFDTPAIPLPDAITPDGIWKQFLYQPADGSVAAAIATAKGGSVYVVFATAPSLNALTTYTPDINVVLLGFRFADAIDLTGAAPAAFDEAMADELTAYIEQALTEYNTLGAAVAVVQNGEVVYAQGFGLREVDGAPVTADTLFMIGSTSKSMTTLMMATLVDDEILSWDQPVTEILPSFTLNDADVTSRIRVRDLVNNTSGVPRYDFPLAFQNQTALEVIGSLANIPLVTAYGEAFHYSNQMVAAGGYIAAIAAGADPNNADSIYSTYVDLMQARVFNPLGFERTTLDFDAALADADHALPYAVNPLDGSTLAVPLKSERFVTPVAPAGAIWSSANEMTRYMQMQLAQGVMPDGTQVVSERNLTETQTPVIEIGDGTSYAMGWIIGDYNGLTMIEHGGNTGGFTSGFAFYPEADFGVIVLSNRQGNNNFSSAITAYVAEQVYGLDHTAGAIYKAQEDQLNQFMQAVNSQLRPVDVDPADVAAYLGEYDYHVSISLNADETRLAVTSDFTDAELAATTQPGMFVVEGSGLIVTFTTASDGTVTGRLESVLDPTQVFILTKQRG